MSVLSSQRPRLSNGDTREPALRLARLRRREALSLEEVWNNAVAFMSLMAIVGMILFLAMRP